ncbi:phosphonate ABC transporter ATP-binding protein [Thalassobaculum sp.]|uniref:phosphonate ABC transporter ATP-binding protein n=1 Tax=Thalassobaculum sp. TaxID=2022740 RepID=UPI0032F0735B
MLEITNLEKRFGAVAAVDRVSLTIPDGQMVGVIGRSGAGKSTLLRLINRLAEPTGGQILFDGTDVSALKGRPLMAWRAHCAMIFQQFNLVNRLDVMTNVLLGRLNYHGFVASMLKRFTPAERAFAIRALDRLDMAQTALQRADTLSGGQQQRVAIARALMQEPKILLADEPIASLDPRNATIVMDALRTINREEGITVVCNLHTLDTARAYCDRIVGMFKGAVVFDGSPSELTVDAARAIYGVDGIDEALAESVTSTSIGPATGAAVPSRLAVA